MNILTLNINPASTSVFHGQEAALESSSEKCTNLVFKAEEEEEGSLHHQPLKVLELTVVKSLIV